MAELPPGWHRGPGETVTYVRAPRHAATVEGCWAIEAERGTMTPEEDRVLFDVTELEQARREERIAVLRELAAELTEGPGNDIISGYSRDLAALLLRRADALEKEPPP